MHERRFNENFLPYPRWRKVEILPTLIEVFLRPLSFYRRKAFYGDGYSRKERKGNLISRFSTLRDMSIELGSKQSFLKKLELPFKYKWNPEYSV